MTNPRRIIAAAVIAAAAVVTTATTADAAGTRHAHTHLEWCGNRAVDYATLVGPDAPITFNEWDRRVAAGWRGIAGDGAERIYPPGCQDVIPYRFRR